MRAKVPEGTLDVQADLVVGADGRHSAVRDLAGLEVEDLGAPMDALWMRLSKRPEDGTVVLGRIQAGHLFVMLDRGDYWQCAFIIPKGGFAELRRRGLPAFRAEIVEAQSRARQPGAGDRILGRREAAYRARSTG